MAKNRLTGSNDKLIKATFDTANQYEIYKRLENIEDILEKYNLDVDELDKKLSRLSFLEMFYSRVKNYELYKFWKKG